MKHTFTCLTALLATVCAGALAAMEAPAVDSAGQAIEEITVTGQRTLFDLRLEVSEAEDAMYNLFNELNTENKYDIVCRNDTRVFSHIRQKVCLPVYAMNALMEEAQGMARGQAGVPKEAILAYEGPQLDEKFRAVMEQSPELFQAVARHYELNAKWRARRKTYFGAEE